jgi:hypothetical protein
VVSRASPYDNEHLSKIPDTVLRTQANAEFQEATPKDKFDVVMVWLTISKILDSDLRTQAITEVKAATPKDKERVAKAWVLPNSRGSTS